MGDGTQEPLIIAGDKLYNYDAILELGKTFKIANCIKESKEVLSKKLYEIEETGSTALGPAVVVSLPQLIFNFWLTWTRFRPVSVWH